MFDSKILKEAIVRGDQEAAEEATLDFLKTKGHPEELLSGAMIPAMEEVGQKFETNEYYIPQMLLAARAMKKALEILKPALSTQETKPIGKVVLGTVRGDLHDIGKNLVGYMLEGNGFVVYDLGSNVASADFVRKIEETKADILAMSALLTSTMVYMKEVVEELEKRGVRGQVKVMIGGAPVTQQFCEEIKADGYSDNANGAVRVAKRLISGV